MAEDWTKHAIRTLISRRQGASSTAWAYRSGSKPCAEPTALAVLGLIAATEGSGSPQVAATLRNSCDWLASLQQANGSVGISEALPEPGWPTAYALLAWKALGGYEVERKRAVDWLLRQTGATMPKDDVPRLVHGHDPSIAGWPWVGGTHSWVEPTALAVLALRVEGSGSHVRVQEGVRLLRDRAIVTGGWNSGNKSTFGRPLRPYPATTGLALLALAHAGPGGELAEDGVHYLLEMLPGVKAAHSLGWGLLGLRAWGRSPREADRWLAGSFESLAGRPDAGCRLAVLLLAAGKKGKEIFDAK